MVQELAAFAEHSLGRWHQGNTSRIQLVETEPRMKIMLVIFFLTVQSSYSTDSEMPATATSFDTVQFVKANGKSWRIKTYAQDQDVHLWSIQKDVPDLEELAKEITNKHYGDILAKEIVIETDEGLDGVRKELRKRGLDANLELPPSGALFWAPNGSRYRSKSVPN
jgi:hypothetical protein